MKKENKKKSPNRIKCQITGQERMSNATYIANKGEKNGVSGNVWASFYVSKDAYKKLVAEVEEFGFKDTAFNHGIDSSTLSKWLRFNGRGGYVEKKQTQPQQETVEYVVDKDGVEVQMA